MQSLESKLGYEFKNKKLLKIALTHSSYANESWGKYKSYERLEFLGDSILSLVTSDYIFKKFPNYPEGKLTKLRAFLVCEKQLCGFSKELELYKYIKVSRGEHNCGGQNRPSILADVFEAICAAIYLDSNYKEASDFILKFIVPAAKNPQIPDIHDYKTDLQEIIQKNPQEIIEYNLVGQSGPDHDKVFTVEVKINNNVVGKGTGKNKKEAEQQAAHEALILMGY
ncbi:MAG: ribonuclease III [Clostridia bacterium]|nr:ribonuclease III [Clostridia bacterium]